MRKELCRIEKEDATQVMIYMSNIRTFNTLKLIYQEKNDPAKISDIDTELKNANEKLQRFQVDLLNKYGVPFFVTTQIYIDVLRRVIYINE